MASDANSDRRSRGTGRAGSRRERGTLLDCPKRFRSDRASTIRSVTCRAIAKQQDHTATPSIPRQTPIKPLQTPD